MNKGLGLGCEHGRDRRSRSNQGETQRRRSCRDASGTGSNVEERGWVQGESLPELIQPWTKHMPTPPKGRKKRDRPVLIFGCFLKKTYVDVRAGEGRKPTRPYISSPKSASTRVWVEFSRSQPFNAIPHTCVCAVVTGPDMISSAEELVPGSETLDLNLQESVKLC